MPPRCPSCQRSVDVQGEPPAFCPYCGRPMAVEAAPTPRPSADETMDFDRPSRGLVGAGVGRVEADLPESVAGYRLVRKLGQGGMGSVHEAEESTSGRRVAIKLIGPEHSTSESAVERFLQEGRLASSISHPRCVFVLAADQSDGWPYIVMELMPGNTLKDLVEAEGPLPQLEAIRKILDVIEGLEEAHKLGVIHRDVKPSNCFLDRDGRVKVGDFGLSKSLLGSNAELTRTGSFLGTPHYASPEQIKGEPIDARSDVYSVAATLFYLLTGSPPHFAEDATVTLARIVTADAPSVRSIRPEIWSALDRAIGRGLERDRRRRYRDLEEFREILVPFLPGGVALGRLTIRAGAYAIDTAIAGALIVASSYAIDAATGGASPAVYRVAMALESGLILVGYFALTEVVGSASIGKRIFRLKVVSWTRRGLATWREAWVRLLVFSSLAFLPIRVFRASLVLWMPRNFGTVVAIIVAFWVVPVVALFARARASNGHRGLHERWSGTNVIRLPASSRRRGRRSSSAETTPLELARPRGMPATVGPFAIRGALVWTAERRLLLGEDVALGRAAWIVVVPPGRSGRLVTPARRDVARIGRPRWVSGGEVDGAAWEAFLAPIGRPLTGLVRASRGLPWPEVRGLLAALADECASACRDGTLPERLAIDRVWVQPNGRALLLGEALDPLAGPAEDVADGDPQARSLELLRRVAICGLSGRSVAAGDRPVPVGAAVPEHAIPALERLTRLGRPYATVDEFVEALAATDDRDPEPTRLRRIGHALFTFVAIELKALLLPALVIAYFLILSAHAGRFIAVPTADDLDHVRAFQSTLWILMAMLVRPGLGGLVFGLTIVGSDGRVGSRLRLALREAALWAPLLAVDSLLEHMPRTGAGRWLADYGTLAASLLLPIPYVLHALFYPGRYLHDRLAGTAVVAR